MLNLKNVCFSVEETKNGKKIRKDILKDINLSASANETVVITGPNGSGKSTLAKIIMGIEKPTSGKIFFNGKDISGLDISQRAKLGISFAFQQPVKFKGITVKDLIEIASGEKVDIMKACEHLSDVGLCARDYINRDVDGSLSGGELKRIEIAQMLARKSKLNIFDEPEAGIDLWSFNSLISVFRMVANKTKGANLIISHQERIIEIADKVVVLSGGKITKEGKPEEIMKEIKPQAIACSRLEVKNVR